MKRTILAAAALLVCLSGCASSDAQMEEALALRGKLLSSGCSFRCEITADYIDTVEVFTLDCVANTDGTVDFTVAEPESISGITGKVSGEEGALTFDDVVLAFPLMADDTLSPVSGPWLLINTLKSGYITACTREGEGLHLTIDDSYADDALTLEIWTDGSGNPISGEISWQGRRVVSMEVEGFSYL